MSITKHPVLPDRVITQYIPTNLSPPLPHTPAVKGDHSQVGINTSVNLVANREKKTIKFPGRLK